METRQAVFRVPEHLAEYKLELLNVEKDAKGGYCERTMQMFGEERLSPAHCNTGVHPQAVNYDIVQRRDGKHGLI